MTPASIDESVLKDEAPRLYAARMAAEKARAVATNSGGFVLAADTVVACGRRILPKADDDNEVRKCLTLLSGRRHQVITAVALMTPDGQLRTRQVMTRVSFLRLTTAQIEAYIQCREGVGKAGGYAIQGRAEIFVKEIAGSWSNVVGLPLAQTVQLLTGSGYVLQ